MSNGFASEEPVCGPERWRELCDVGYVDSICEHLRELPADSDQGSAADIRQRIIAPLVAYAATRTGRLEAYEAEQLARKTEELALALESGVMIGTPADLVRDVEHAWFRWIASEASYELWGRQPRAAAVARANGKKRRPEKAEAVDAACRRLLASGSVDERSVAGIVARQVECTPAYVRQILRKRKIPIVPKR